MPRTLEAIESFAGASDRVSRAIVEGVHRARVTSMALVLREAHRLGPEVSQSLQRILRNSWGTDVAAGGLLGELDVAGADLRRS